MTVKVLGIDLGKTVFHLIGMDAHGKIVLKKRYSRSQLLKFLANTPACLIGMEASCGCHHVGRTLASFGHEVRLIPAQFVKPYVKSQKNDYRDAEAIAEAVQRPTMRFVPIKTQEQLDIQAVHRVRERLLAQRTSLVNQLRAFFLERGLIVRAGRAYLWRAIPEVLTNGMAFKKGREFSAWLGLVPHQCSTGGHTKLLGISKRGNEYLRRLFIHGARSVCLHVNRTRHVWGEWVTTLKSRKPSNVATVALANKLARIAWSVLRRNEVYRAILTRWP